MIIGGESYPNRVSVIRSWTVTLSLVIVTFLIPSNVFGQLNLWDAPQGLPNLDNRGGSVAPTVAQLSRVQSLGESGNLPATQDGLINVAIVNGNVYHEPGTNTAAARPALDACSLIEKREIESVQGAKLQSTTPSIRSAPALAISQCYYTVVSSAGSQNLSVHLEVMQNDPKGANQNAVASLWRERFKEAKEKEKPKLVTGVGDDAYWVGNNKFGALYVLKKDKLVRVSVGGPDDQVTKIGKSKILAQKVLKRLF